MTRFALLMTASFLFATSLVAAPADDAAISFEKNDQGVLALEGKTPIAFYQATVKSLDGQAPRANYLHPVYDLAGNVFTEDFPKDHKHHRGIFWTWHQVKINGKQMGDAWLCKDFVWDIQNTTTSNDNNGGTLDIQTQWQSPLHKNAKGEMIPFVQENVSIHFYSKRSNYRVMDFEIQLKALIDNVAIGGSDDAKGYGGFSPRIKLTPDMIFSGTHGTVTPQKLAVANAGPWIDISNAKRGITIMDHKTNPDYPQPWILRAKTSMQNPKWPGQIPFALSTTKPVTLRYRMVIHEGPADKKLLDRLQAEFSE